MRFLTTPLFWLGRFLRARLIGWGFIALLATVAYFSARLTLDTQYKTPRMAAPLGQKHAPDFTAKQFTFWRSSLDGATQYQFSGESMTRYRDDLSVVIVKPLIVAKTSIANAKPNQHGKLVTTITAGNGLMRNDGELVQFTGAVKVVRKSPDAPLSTLQSDSLVIMPDSDWMATRSPVTVSQGKNQSIAKGGMEFSHADADLQLLGPVRTTIAPP